MGISLKRCGVVGCGAMGSGIAKSLLKAGYRVAVYDVRCETALKLAEAGAVYCGNVQDLVKRSRVVITSLPSPEVLSDVLAGERGIFSYLHEGSYVLDMGTTDVELTRRLHRTAKEKGIAFLDCPVSGGPAKAHSGTLTIMVGGEKAQYDAVLPVLNAVGETIQYVGKSGSGQVVKLCNNIVVAGTIVLLCEAFLTAEREGVPSDTVGQVLKTGSGGSNALSVFGPNMINRDYHNVLFMLGHMAKDVRLFYQMTKTLHIPAQLSSVVHTLFEQAVEDGKTHLDTAGIMSLFEEWINKNEKGKEA